MEFETRWQVTEQVLALVKRAKDALGKVDDTSVNANGVFHHPAILLAALKATRGHIDKAIASMEKAWPA